MEGDGSENEAESELETSSEDEVKTGALIVCRGWFSHWLPWLHGLVR